VHVFIHTSLLGKLASFISHFQYLHKYLTVAEFKDCVRSCKVCFFCWKKSLWLFVLENPPCASPSTGLHVVVFKELIKLRVHSLDIKELILIIFLNLWPLFVPSLFSFQFIPGTEQRLKKALFKTERPISEVWEEDAGINRWSVSINYMVKNDNQSNNAKKKKKKSKHYIYDQSCLSH